MRRIKEQTALLSAIVAVALLVRLAVGFWWQQRLPAGQTFVFPDSYSYWELARAIASGQPYEYPDADTRIFRTPGYPILLSPLFRIAGEQPPIMWGRGVGAVLGTLAVVGVAGLARTLFDWRAALVAAAITAVYPGAIAMSIFVLSEAPFCPLMLLQLAFWATAWEASGGMRRGGLALAGGFAGGAATLMRPSWLLFTPLAVGLSVVIGPQRSRHLAIGLAMCLGIAIVMTPWWVRNYRVAGRFVPTTLQVGASLYDGLNPRATGASNMDFTAAFYRQLREDELRSGSPAADTFEWRLDRRYRAAAWQWARTHPRRVLQLAAIKFLRMWSPWPNAAELESLPIRLAVMVTYTPVLGLGLAGALAFARRGWPVLLCVLPAVYFTALHIVFVSSIRYRQPAMLTLIVLAAGMAVWSWNWMRGAVEIESTPQ